MATGKLAGPYYRSTLHAMDAALKILKRIFVAAYLVFLHILLLYFIGERIWARYIQAPEPAAEAVSDPTEMKEVPTPLSIPSISPNSDTAVNSSQTTAQANSKPAGSLIIPVAGVKAEQLVDSFSEARSEGRIHDAIDIAAPPRTPVIAAADGEIINFFDSELGGITIYQLSTDRRFVYYYAHLQRRADDVKVGDIVERGRTIGYVGDTGNAGAGNYHLHFSIAAITDPKRFWEGVYINPYPLLKDQTGSGPN